MNTTSLYATPTIKHPDFCDPRSCRTEGDNIFHGERPVSWEAAEDDVTVTVGMSRTDELVTFRDPIEQDTGTLGALLTLRHTGGDHVADHAGQVFPVACEVLLSAVDCRHLAARLVELADRLHDAEVAAFSSVERGVR